jgi:eukaryotic-like serine/threonine-protein kinase
MLRWPQFQPGFASWETYSMPPALRIGRYLLYDVIATGGMASVRLGKLMSEIGIGRIVAIKCLHPTYAEDPAFVSMLVEEATLALRLQHPNIVPTLDVISQDGRLFIVMEYVQGASLAVLMRKAKERGVLIPHAVAARIMIHALEGLHTAHDARSPKGEPLSIVHRDVSPQNIMVGADGVSRVLDFGIAKAAGSVQTTREGQLKGKVSYMAPEQVEGVKVDRRADLYAAGVVLWELLTGKRLYANEEIAGVLGAVLFGTIENPCAIDPSIPESLGAAVMQALSRDPDKRFVSARAMAEAIESAVALATDRTVAALVKDLDDVGLAKRASLIESIEAETVAGGPDDKTLQPEAIEARVESHNREKPLPPSEQTTPMLVSIDQAGREIVRRASMASIQASEPLPRPRRSGPVVVGAFLLLGIAIAVLLVWRLTPSAQAPVPSAVASNPAPNAAAPSASALVSAQPPVDSAHATTDSVAARPPAPKPPGASARPPTGATTSTAKSPPPATGGCNPPWTIDERGVRVPKPNCI